MDSDSDGETRLRDLLDKGWTQQGLRRVDTRVLQFPAEANRWTAVVQATVETERGSFAALGEASGGVSMAEDRAVARALGWATNGIEAPETGRQLGGDGPVPGPASGPAPRWTRSGAPEQPDRVPEFLAARSGPASAPAAEPTTAASAPPTTARPPRDGGARIFATAQSLAKACANLGLPAPEPEAGWSEARLQEYVDTWSAELRRVRAGSGARL